MGCCHGWQGCTVAVGIVGTYAAGFWERASAGGRVKEKPRCADGEGMDEQTCAGCGQRLSAARFRGEDRGRPGRVCRVCLVGGEQRCGTCREVLPVEAFSPCYRGEAGRPCRACKAVEQRRRQPVNRAYLRAYDTARRRALSQLRELHQAEYLELLGVERERVGL
jgi:hypothetical protein